MRLHRLTITAIGPFAETQHVDFERLSDGGIFLLEGPTGAGKSTVLDALTFALYGGIATDDADVARLHSHFAADATTPEVVLEFSLAGQRFRITRTPAHLRPRKRGGGMTQEKSSAHLQRESGAGWESVSDKQDEIGAAIERELGLNRAQFTQVVLLPQGEFAKFLKSDDDTRRKLLTKLFGAERFERITAWLEQSAKAARSQQREAETEIGKALSAAIEAGRVNDDLADSWVELADGWTPESATKLSEQLTSFAAATSESVQEAQIAQSLAVQTVEAASKHLADLQEEAALIKRRTSALARQREQERSKQEQVDRKSAVAAAQRAVSVLPLLTNVDQARAVVGRKSREAVSIAGGAADLAQLGNDWKSLLEQGRAGELLASTLTPLVQLEADLPSRMKALAAAAAARDEADVELQRLKREQEALPAQITTLQSELTEARVAVGRVSGLTSELEGWRNRAAAQAKLQALQPELDAALAAEKKTFDAYKAAVDAHQRLMERRIAGMTGELAGRLVDGEPCQVCGSTEHPAPATSEAEAVTPAAVEAASQQRDVAEQARRAAENQRQALEKQAVQAQAQVGEMTAADVTANLERAEAEAAAMSAKAAGVSELEGSLAEVQERADGIAEALTTLSAELAERRSAYQALAEQIQADQAQVAREADGFESVSARADELTATAQGLTRAGEAIRELEVAEAALRLAEAAALREATAQGFADVASAAEVTLDSDALAELTTAIAAWDSEGAAVAELLADPDVAGANLERVDVIEQELAVAASAKESAEMAKDLAITTLRGLETRSRRFDERRADVQRCLRLREELGREHAALLDLDILTRGMSGAASRMTLTTYVLRLWFEQVVQAANTRLHRIAGGKYELRRTEESGNAKGRVGLGLTVFDRHTGKERSPGSLSGGETFYTSLALALGLADVVQAEAGGVSLDTLFIDEGFGSLDSETLEEVLTVIDGLRDNGRVVGIVSHVEELKERVPERLEVRRTRDDGPSQVRVVA